MAKPYAQSTVTEAEIEGILENHAPVCVKVLADGRQVYGCRMCSRNDGEEWPCLAFRTANYVLEMRGYAVRLEKRTVRQHLRIANQRQEIDALAEYRSGSPFEQVKDILRYAFGDDDQSKIGSVLYQLRPILAELVGLPPRRAGQPQPHEESIAALMDLVQRHAVKLIAAQMAQRKAGNLPPAFVTRTLPDQPDPPTLYATLKDGAVSLDDFTTLAPEVAARVVEAIDSGDLAFTGEMRGGKLVAVGLVPLSQALHQRRGPATEEANRASLDEQVAAAMARTAKAYARTGREKPPSGTPMPGFYQDQARRTHDEAGFPLCPRCGRQKDEEDASLCAECSSADIASSMT